MFAQCNFIIKFKVLYETDWEKRLKASKKSLNNSFRYKQNDYTYAVVKKKTDKPSNSISIFHLWCARLVQSKLNRNDFIQKHPPLINELVEAFIQQNWSCWIE